MSVQMNVPQLRFSEFSGEWEDKKINDIAKISSGGTPLRNNIKYWNGDIPWISTTLINFNNIYSSKEYITEEGLKNSSAKLFPINTILMAMYGQGKTRGKVAILKISATTNQACAAILPKNIYYLFLYQYLSGQYDNIRNISNEGGQKNLSASLIKGIKLSIPSKLEQQRIASFLTFVDTKIEQLTKKEKLLQKYKKGVIQKIFSQEIRFKEDDGSEYPEWVEKILEEVFLITSGKSKSKHINKNGKNIIVDMGGISSEPKLIANKNTDYSNDYLTTKDLVMPKDDIGGGFIIGKVVEIPENNKYICGDHIYKLTVKCGHITFLKYIINSYSVNKSFRQKANGTAQIGLNKKAVETQKVVFPCLEEQIKIANFLSSIDKKIESVLQQLNQTKEFKKALLQQMFV